MNESIDITSGIEHNKREYLKIEKTMNDKDLLKLKKKVDNAQYEEQQLKGERKATLANLKEDFDCSDVEEAEQLKQKLKKKLKKYSNQLEEKLKEIEKEYLPDEETE